MLALSDASFNGIITVAVAVIGGGVSIAVVLLSRSTKRANDGIDELARDHADCLETLDWVVGQLKVEGSLPPSAVRIRAQAARAAAQAAREKAERQRRESAGSGR